MLLMRKLFCLFKKRVFKTSKKYTSIEGIIYSIENNKIISLQDNFKYLGDVLFTVYFDFETTTGVDIFQDPKMFAINYCQINVFHLALNLDKKSFLEVFNRVLNKSLISITFGKGTFLFFG